MSGQPDSIPNYSLASYNVVLRCLRYALAPVAERSPLDLKPAEVAWPEFLSIAQQHGVVPLVNLAINQSESVLPDAVAWWLSEQSRRGLVHNLSLSSELLDLLDAFSKAGLTAVPFKGPALAASLYGNLSLRPIADLDLFVSRKDALSCVTLLQERGYVLADRFPGLSPKQIFRGSKDIDLTHPDTGIHVELHWAACEPEFDRRLFEAELWTPATTARLLDGQVPLPRAEDLLFLLSIHGARHRWQCLKWICDVAVLLRVSEHFDWDYLLERADRFSRRRMLLLSLLLAERLAGMPLPPRVLQLIQDDRKLDGLLQQVELLQLSRAICAPELSVDAVLEGAGSEVFRFRITEGFGNQAALIARFFLTRIRPTAEDQRYFALPAMLAPGRWLVRPIRLCLQYGPGTIVRLSSRLRAGLARTKSR